MNPKSLVRLSNIVGIIAIVLLIYWVFIFVSIEVFGLKVFRENMTETFFMSVLGILSLMAGALIINIMFNLTRIAEKHNQDREQINKVKSKSVLMIALSFPIIFGLLFVGDYLTAKKKESVLIESAKSIIEDNAAKSDKLLNYTFDKKWIIETGDILEIMSKTDKNFPQVSVIVKDSIDNSKVFLGFSGFYGSQTDTLQPQKKHYIFQTTQADREYLTKMFDENSPEIRFSSHDGRYELYYPYFKNNHKIILYFSEFQPYGKLGS